MFDAAVLARPSPEGSFSRYPVAGDAEAGPRATVDAKALVPPPLGPLLVMHHEAAYELALEHVREQQPLATARFVAELRRPEHPPGSWA
jgi:hypothetical protein